MSHRNLQPLKRIPNGWYIPHRSFRDTSECPYYGLSTAQKLEVCSLLAPRRPVLAALAIAAAMTIWAFCITAMVSGAAGDPDNPGYWDVFAILVLVLTPAAAVLPVAAHGRLRRIKRTVLERYVLE